MATLNLQTGMWEDDANGPAGYQPGSLGMQQDTPHALASMPPAPLPADNTPVAPQPMSPAALAAMNAPPPAQPPPVPPPPAAQLGSPAPAPPAGPTVAPYAPQTMPVPPVGRVVSPTESATLGQIDTNEAARGVAAQQAGQVGVQKANAVLDASKNDEAERIQHQKDQQKIIDDAAKRTQQLEAAAKAQYDEYRQMGIKDPEAGQSFGHQLLAAIAVGLGEYSSKMNGGPNRAAELIAAANAQNIALQKAAIEKKYKEFQAAGGDVLEAKKERDDALKMLEMKHAALLAASAGKLKTELTRMGIPEAQIAANQEIQKVEALALDKRETVLAGIRANETDLMKADLASADKARALAAKKAKGAGGGGSPGALEKISQYIKDHPDDQPGQYAMAEQMGYRGPKAAALVDKLQNDYKKGKADKAEADDTAVRDEAGNIIGHVPTGRGGAQGFATRDADYQRAQQQLKLYQADIAANGERVFGPEAVKRRQTLKHNADIAVATVSPLGKTDEAMKAEAGSIGSSGAYSLTGANREAVKTKIKELQEQQERYRKQTLIPEKGGGEHPGAPAAREGSASPVSDRASRAKAIVSDQSKRSLYTTEQWAALVKASRAQ